MKVLTIFTLGALVAGSVCTTGAQADVTLKQKVSVQASGTMSMMASEGTVTTLISGHRGRTENQMESKSAMMRRIAKNMNTATIVLLDDDRMITLMPEKKKYSEMSLSEMRAQIEKSMAQAEQMQQGGGLPVSEDGCEWTEPVLKVDKTGERRKFAGVKAKQTIITATQTCTDFDTGNSCDMTWNMEYWNAKRMPGRKEAKAFQEGMARAMGGDEMLSLAKASTRGLLSMFKKGWDDVLDESGDLEGYPVKTVMSMEIGGENCVTSAGQQIAMDDVWSNAANAGVDAAAGSAAGHLGAEVGNQTAKAMGDSVGGSIAGSAIGAASRELIGGAFSKFRKKKKKPAPEPEAEALNPADGSVVLFKISTELVDISERDIAESQFDVPANWKRVK